MLYATARNLIVIGLLKLSSNLENTENVWFSFFLLLIMSYNLYTQ